MRTLEEFKERFLQPLADLCADEGRAQQLVQSFGYPASRILRRSDSSQFWFKVCREIGFGIMPNGRGLADFVRFVGNHYPANEVFGPHRSGEGAQPSDLAAGRVDPEGGQAAGARPEKPAVKVLFLCANPKGTRPLVLDEEIRDIEAAIRDGDLRERFAVVSAFAVRSDGDLRRSLLQHKPTVVHISGHGISAGDLLLEDERRSDLPHALEPAKLARIFQHLIAFVVGRPREIFDEEALSFSKSFYQALAYGRSVRNAFDIACASVPNGADAPNPVLLIRDGEDADVSLV